MASHEFEKVFQQMANRTHPRHRIPKGSQEAVVDYLNQHQVLTIPGLAKALDVSYAAASALVARMQYKGLVARRYGNAGKRGPRVWYRLKK